MSSTTSATALLPPTGHTPRFSIRESRDLDHYRTQPGNWSVEVNQLAKGSFGSRIRSLELPGFIAYHNQWDCPALVHGQSPEGWLMFGGMVAPERATVFWCGQRLDRERFAATGDNQEIEFHTENRASNVVVLVEPSMLVRTVGDEAVELLQSNKHLDFGQAGCSLIKTVMGMLARAEAQPSLLDQPAIVSRAISNLMGGVEECFATLNLGRTESEAVSRGELVHKAVLHVHQSGVATSAWGMAQAVGVSQKALELAFREVMDTTPGRYLMLTRLNGAHHALAYADRANTKVIDIALGFGFTHMGRFAKAYKDLFGELPSQTLER